MKVLRPVGATLSALLLSAVPTIAFAHQHLDCDFISGGIVCVGEADGALVRARDPGPSPTRSDSPYYYTSERAIGPCPPGETYWWIHTHWRESGQIISSVARCVADAEPTPPPPPPPPPPPTEAQFVREIGSLLELQTGISPPADGLGGVSQLETWLWCDNAGDVTVDVSLNGWRAAATAHVTRLTWTIDGPDGPTEVSATECGSAPDPSSDGDSAAARWTPDLPGDYTIALSATWGGTWTRSFGGVSQTLDLGAVTIDGLPIAYRVVEIQTVGVDNR